MKNGGRILWNAIYICEKSKTSWQMGEQPMRDDSENHSKDGIFPFGANFEYFPISAKDQSMLHQVGKRVLPGMFLGICIVRSGEFSKGDI